MLMADLHIFPLYTRTAGCIHRREKPMPLAAVPAQYALRDSSRCDRRMHQHRQPGKRNSEKDMIERMIVR
jgi:hypothetical protein